MSTPDKRKPVSKTNCGNAALPCWLSDICLSKCRKPGIDESVTPLPVKQKIIRRTARMNGSQRARSEIESMIRVTKTEEGERTRITIEGQLSRDYIEVVEICCDQAASKGKPIDVFLHDVLTIDESGRALLSRLAAKGIRLLASGIYASYVVPALMSADTRAPVSPLAAAGASGEGTSRKFEGNYG
jgi:hypothetical protein